MTNNQYIGQKSIQQGPTTVAYLYGKTFLSGLCPKHHIRRGASSADHVLPRSWLTDEGNVTGKTEKEHERNHRLTFSSFKHPLHQPPPDLVYLSSISPLTPSQRDTHSLLFLLRFSFLSFWNQEMPLNWRYRLKKISLRN